MHEPALHVDLTFSGSRYMALIFASWLHDMGELIIPQIDIQDFLTHPTDMSRVFEREEKFHAAIKVAFHQIGRAQVDLFLTAVEKVEDAAVLVTRIFSLRPSTPGRRRHMPRTNRSIWTPAWEAR
jgi:hypothetical protein